MNFCFTSTKILVAQATCTQMVMKIEKFNFGLRPQLKFHIIAVLQFLFVITNDLKCLLKFRIDGSCQKEILAEENILTFASQNLAEHSGNFVKKAKKCCSPILWLNCIEMDSDRQNWKLELPHFEIPISVSGLSQALSAETVVRC